MCIVCPWSSLASENGLMTGVYDNRVCIVCPWSSLASENGHMTGV